MSTELKDLIAQARWFGGKGRPFEVARVEELGALGSDSGGSGAGGWDAGGSNAVPAQAWVATLDFGMETDRYLLWSPGGPESRGPGLPDLTTSPDGLRALWRGFVHPAPGPIRCRVLRTLPAEAEPTPLNVEQSNTSVRFGEQWMLKLFRRLATGVNPDIELHEVLTRAGSTDIAGLDGWIETEIDGEFAQLGILQEFLPGAVDGWATALAALRGSDPDSFTGHSAALGAALGRVHAVLARQTPGAPISGQDLALAMTARLDAATDIVPALRAHRDQLSALYDRVRAIAAVSTHRIHGDFHLGQALLSEGRWRLVDFEGEPAAAPADRVRPDSPWRDLAGMLRSLHYSSSVAAAEGHPHAGWYDDQAQAFISGYLTGEQAAQARPTQEHPAQEHSAQEQAARELGADERTLLTAYVADKAVYETVYETRHRPDWVDIPLSALTQIGAR